MLFEFSNQVILRLPDGAAYEWKDGSYRYFIQRQDGGGNPIELPVAETPFRVKCQPLIMSTWQPLFRSS
ncbi:hypothetical protein AN926_06365 [Thermus scotoductus]|uniref:Uncharacterized protein n=1 Tax=Thermus scotoductus TaxID=37636 RepID=A0A0N0ZPE7_THESC|nr:hypothetical protein AN926_06365 [Thermus scotoductus]